MPKPLVIYNSTMISTNPMNEGVGSVAIRTNTQPYYVHRVYFRGTKIPDDVISDRTMSVIPIEDALRAFKFMKKSGKL